MTVEVNSETTKRQYCFGSLAVGAVLATMGVAAMRIDLINNYEFGTKISHELGLAMALAAIAVTALPSAAALLGKWDRLLRVGTAMAVLLTVLAAISAYAEKQGAEILARQGAGDAYKQAQADVAAARKAIEEGNAEAKAITETATVADLETLVAFHQGKAKEEIEKRGGPGKNSKAHEVAETEARARIPAARAKAAALARVAEAQARLDAALQATKSGPAEVSMLATAIAGQTGKAPEDIARAIALITSGFGIAMTLIMALVAEKATLLMKVGLGFSGAAAPAVQRAIKTVGAKSRKDETLEKLISLILANEEGYLCCSGRALGPMVGIKSHSTFASWLESWIAEGKIKAEPVTAHKKMFRAAA